jgi:hypothetical protein
MSMFGKIKTAAAIAGAALLVGCDSDVKPDPSSSLPQRERFSFKYEIQGHDLLKFAGIEKLDRSNSGQLLSFINSNELAKPEVVSALQDFLKVHGDRIADYDPLTWTAIKDSLQLMEATGAYVKSLEDKFEVVAKLVVIPDDKLDAIGKALQVEQDSSIYYSKDGLSLKSEIYLTALGKATDLQAVARLNPEVRKGMMAIGSMVFDHFEDAFKSISFDSVAEFDAAEAEVKKLLSAYEPVLDELGVKKYDFLRSFYQAGVPQLLEKANDLLCQGLAVAHDGHESPEHTAKLFKNIRDQIMNNVAHLDEVRGDPRVADFMGSEDFKKLGDHLLYELEEEFVTKRDALLAEKLPTNPEELRKFSASVGGTLASYNEPDSFHYRLADLKAEYAAQVQQAEERVLKDILPALEAETQKIVALDPAKLPSDVLFAELDRVHNLVATACELHDDFKNAPFHSNEIQSRAAAFVESSIQPFSSIIGIGLVRNEGDSYQFSRGKSLYLAAGYLSKANKISGDPLIAQGEIECLRHLAGDGSQYFPQNGSISMYGLGARDRRDQMTDLMNAAANIAMQHSMMRYRFGSQSQSSASAAAVGGEPRQQPQQQQAKPARAGEESEVQLEVDPKAAK